jgi:hypothetical protein
LVKYAAETKCVIGAGSRVRRTSSSASSPSGDRYAPSQSIVIATTIRPLGAGEQPPAARAVRAARTQWHARRAEITVAIVM